MMLELILIQRKCLRMIMKLRNTNRCLQLVAKSLQPASPVQAVT